MIQQQNPTKHKPALQTDKTQCYLFQRDQQITLPPTYTFNSQVYPAFNSTYLVHEYPFLNKGCAHFDQSGNVIKKLELPQGAYLSQQNMCMISDRVVIMTIRTSQRRYPILVQWNLQTGQSIHHLTFNSMFHDGNTNNSLLFYFPKSQLICLIQSTSHQKDMQCRLLTFKAKLQTAGDKPIAQFHSQIKSEINFNLFKLNHESKIAWVTNTPFLTEITIIDVIQSKQNKFTFRHKFNKNLILTFLIIIDVWQPREGHLYIKYKIKLDIKAIQSAYTAQRLQKNKEALLDMEKQAHIIWNYETDQFIELKDRNFCTIQFLSGLRNAKGYETVSDKRLLLSNKQSSKPLMVPTFYKRLEICYIQNSNWSIVATEPQGTKFIGKIMSPYLYNYLDYSTNTYYKVDKKSVNERTMAHITIRKLRDLCFSHSVVASFLITALIKQCDDDLIMAVVGLTQDRQYEHQNWRPAIFQQI